MGVVLLGDRELPYDGFYEDRAEAAEIEEDTFTLKGVRYSVRWLGLNDASRARAEFEN